MLTEDQERQRLRKKIGELDTIIKKTEALHASSPDAGYDIPLEKHRLERNDAVKALEEMESLMMLRHEVARYQQRLSQQERIVQDLREKYVAAERLLTSAELDLETVRRELAQKESNLNQRQAPRPLAFLRMENGSTEPILKLDVIVGRERTQGVDIAMNNPAISGRHLRIRFDGTYWTATDLKSANGTWVGNNHLTPDTPTQLVHGTTISVAGVVSATFELPPTLSPIGGTVLLQ